MTCTRDFSRALSKLRGIAAILDWFIALFARAVIGRRNSPETFLLFQIVIATPGRMIDVLGNLFMFVTWCFNFCNKYVKINNKLLF